MPTTAKERALLHVVVLPEKELPAAIGLSQISLEELKQSFASTPIANALADLRAKGFNIRSFNQNRIEGTIHLDQDAVVVFQIPFDAGWSARANGTRAPLLKVDVGLLGIALKAGEHDLKLQFVPRFLYTGCHRHRAVCADSRVRSLALAENSIARVVTEYIYRKTHSNSVRGAN